MSDTAQPPAPKFSVDELLKELAKPPEPWQVPEPYTSKFTALEVGEKGAGGFGFGFGRAVYMAGCNSCGALVYPTALDRHVYWHSVERTRPVHPGLVVNELLGGAAGRVTSPLGAHVLSNIVLYLAMGQGTYPGRTVAVPWRSSMRRRTKDEGDYADQVAAYNGLSVVYVGQIRRALDYHHYICGHGAGQ